MFYPFKGFIQYYVIGFWDNLFPVLGLEEVFLWTLNSFVYILEMKKYL